VAVGCIPNYTNNSSQSIISVFDKGENDDSDTLRNRYMKFLPNRWNSTRDDIFTVYLPVNLCDYTDPNTADNWKAGSHLDNEFKWNILIDHNELSSIFDNDTEHTNLLSQLGMDLNKVDRNINLILEKINYSFLEKYYNNSSYPIAEYINKTIQDAYYNANEEIKGKIRDQKNSLIYPVCDLTSSKSPELYLIIHPENKEFAKNQLEFNIEKTFEQYTMPKHQMVFVGIVQGINYSDLMGSEENKKVYLERDLNHFRPHINAKWNDYPNGPWDAEKIELNKTI
jgi:hypothetical protein